MNTLSGNENVALQEDHDIDLTTSIPTELINLVEIFDKLADGTLTLQAFAENNALKTVTSKLVTFKKSLEGNRTSKLWMQYMDMVELLRQFIAAERSGDWLLHLKSVYDMLPYLAASGHNLYVKSAHIYLQYMQGLKDTHPGLDEKFKSGFHVIRRSDRYWAGLSTDLVIEQSLMRSLKTTGGLTRGRGLTETQRAQWLSMPHLAEMIDAKFY